MKIISKAGWGGKPPRCGLSTISADGIAVHYTASYADEFGDPKARLREIQRYHTTPGGHDPTLPWCDFAYNYAFDRNGNVYEGRGWNKRSAAQGTNDGNNRYMAIVFLGTDKEGRDDVTAKGRKALGDFILWAEKRAGKRLDVKPHNFFHGTECPGDELRQFILMKGWRFENEKPKRLPKWFWKWNAWRLGEGTYKQFGPKNKKHRPKGVPRVIPPWAWARAKQFDRARANA